MKWLTKQELAVLLMVLFLLLTGLAVKTWRMAGEPADPLPPAVETQ